MEILKTRRDVERPDRPAVTFAYFMPGPDLKDWLHEEYSFYADNVYSFTHGSDPGDQYTLMEVQGSGSPYPIYCYYLSTNRTLFWFSPAERVFLNADSSFMFSNWYYLKSVNFAGISGASVRTFSSMFSQSYNLSSVYFPNFITQNATSFVNMFSSCVALTYLDISTFSSMNATDTSSMFGGCNHLQKIVASPQFVAPANSTRMFQSCTALVGGAGTVYDSNHVDGTYARIDNPPTAPGYFTEATP